MIDDKSSGKASTTETHPMKFSNAQIAENPILQFFDYAHLPAMLQAISVKFFFVASFIVTNLPRNAERTVALRKLLEAKDAAVRASLPTPGFGDKPHVASQQLGEPREIQNATDDRDGPISFDG